MKHYFKYGSGFVNINTEDLFLTNSGNWQETWDLKEKSPASKRKNAIRIARMQIYIYVVFGVVAVISFFMLKNAVLPGGLLVLAYFVNKYFKSEMGKRYKIPLVKIQSIEKYEKGLKINFRNAANEPDFEIIDDVDPKGFSILEELKRISSQPIIE